MRLKTKLITCFLLTTLVLIVLATAGIYLSKRLNENFSYIVGDIIPSLAALGQIKSAALTLEERSVLLYTESPNKARNSPIGESPQETIGLEELIKTLRRNLTRYLALAREQPAEHPVSDEIEVLTKAIISLSRKVDAVRNGEDKTPDPDKTVAEIEKKTLRLIRFIDLQREIQLVGLKERERLSRYDTTQVIGFHFAAIVFSLLFAYGLGIWAAVFLAQPIIRMRNAALEFGKGNLDIRIENTRKDELGELADALNHMADNLKQTTVSRAHMDSIVNSMAVTVIVLDRKRMITRVNPATLTLLGYAEQELLGQSISKVFPDCEAVLPLDREGTVFVSEEINNCEATYVTRNGRELSVSLSASMMLGNDGRTEGVVLMSQDITEQKKYESELRAYRQKLTHAEQLASLGAMSAILAHKLNQPLTAIRLYLQQCLRACDPIDPPKLVSDNLKESLEEVQKASSTIKKVLTYTRACPTDLAEEVDLAEIAQKIFQVVRESAARANINIHVEDLRGLPRILAGPGEIEQIFFILIQNAIQAAEEQESSVLNISASVRDKELRLIFADTCGGIAEENIDRVFELFFTTKSPEQGTGLGLCIVQQILRRLQGNVRVESTYGKGTTFYVSLPIDQSESMSDALI